MTQEYEIYNLNIKAKHSGPPLVNDPKVSTKQNSTTFFVSSVELDKSLSFPIEGKGYHYLLDDKKSLKIEKMEFDLDKGDIVTSTGAFKNGFIDAIYDAFSTHRHLTISPDHIWLLILQGFSTHLNQEDNSEKYRKCFVDFEGKAELTVVANDFVKGSPNNNWGKVTKEFMEQMNQKLIGDSVRLTDIEFSTSTTISKISLQSTFMYAMRHYFDYKVMTMCGIPKFTIKGTLSDWEKILDSLKLFNEYGLEWWVEKLQPILEHFISVKRGESPDLHFWNSIFKYYNGPGGSGSCPLINGWITYFFPYINGKVNEFTTGIEPCDIPSGIYSFPIEWKYYDETFKMLIYSGFIGFKQNRNTKEVSANIGYAFCEKDENEDYTCDNFIPWRSRCHLDQKGWW
jgi:hypothetical protein